VAAFGNAASIVPQSAKLASYQGILGGQGTGKTTLAAMLSLILGQLGYHTLSLSLDDLQNL